MIYISSNSDGSSVINLTVGDDATLTVPLKTDDGEDYEMTQNEYLIFTVREKPSPDSTAFIEIQSDPGSNDINITHNDTASMIPGFYSAEVQLMANDGKRITVWPKLTGKARTSFSNRKNFCLMTEVVDR